MGPQTTRNSSWEASLVAWEKISCLSRGRERMAQASPRACFEQFLHLPPWVVKAFVFHYLQIMPVAMTAPGTAHEAELGTAWIWRVPWAGHPNTCTTPGRGQPGLPREAALAPFGGGGGTTTNAWGCDSNSAGLKPCLVVRPMENHMLGMSSSKGDIPELQQIWRRLQLEITEF